LHPRGRIFIANTIEWRMIVSADTDFGALLVLHRSTKPSFILLRGDMQRHPEAQADLLARELPHLEAELLDGAIVSISRGRIRVRRLPRPAG